jgi:hypothetical protein
MPCEYVIITGTGWMAGEIEFSFWWDTQTRKLLSHDITTVADGNGKFIVQSF